MEKEKGILSRRQVLKAGMLTGMGLFLLNQLGTRTASGQEPAGCIEEPGNWNLTPFLDALPLMPTLAPTLRQHGATYYTLSAEQVMYQFHSQLPPSEIWGFNGITPGPTIEAERDHAVRVTLTNNLRSYLLCIDPQVHGTFDVPYITMHNHGLLDRQDSDGFPEDRFPPGVSYTYEYPNIQPAATYWYHDHNLGVTRLAVHSGLAGFYLLRDRREKRFRLPEGEFEIPLLIQDKSFSADGSIWLSAPPWEPEFFGDFAVVNGKVWPFLNVKRGKYRFRILNGSNARFYNLKLDPAPPAGAFLQIGTDAGLMAAPVDLTDSAATPMGGLLIAPSERADIVIDFSAFSPGTEVILINDAPAPFPGGGEKSIDTIMKFVVTDAKGWSLPVPQKLNTLPVAAPAVKTRFLTLVDYGSPVDGYPPPPPNFPYPTLLLNNRMWSEPPTETPKAGSTEIWSLINLAPDTHPIHVHQTSFRILGRQDFDVGAYLAQYGVNGPVDNPTIPFTGAFTPPYPFENGLKDTVRANPAQVTTIEIPFGPFRGRFVWHCHILDHEDNEMMRPFLIT